MELRDDLAEARRRHVGTVVLELCESASDKLGLGGLSHEVSRGVALEELVEAPRVLVALDDEGLHALLREMLGDADHVLLQHLRREDVGIDALQYVARPRLRLDLERVVDVARAEARHVRLVRDAHRREGRIKLLLGVFAVAHGLLLALLAALLGGRLLSCLDDRNLRGRDGLAETAEVLIRDEELDLLGPLGIDVLEHGLSRL